MLLMLRVVTALGILLGIALLWLVLTALGGFIGKELGKLPDPAALAIICSAYLAGFVFGFWQLWRRDSRFGTLVIIATFMMVVVFIVALIEN